VDTSPPISEVLNIQDIKRRSFIGVIALTSRTFILQIIALVSTFILTVLLDPAAFGVFFVVTAAVNFLNYFSDIGLAAALIQKKEEPTRDDLVTTFTIQQILVGTAVCIALFISGWVGNFYKLGGNGIFLFRALAFAFMLSSLKTIPSILLERKLDFHKLVIPQVVETLTFYLVAITLAVAKFGVVSFAWAALARGITGTVALYIVAPWRPGVGLNRQSARHLLSFGLPFQANSFLALVKDDLLTVFLGKMLPFAQIGYIGWAKKWAEIALRLIMDNIIRVTFPTFARLQHEPQLLAKAIHKSLLFLALLSLPIAFGMIFMIKPFILIVPKYAKWEPALFSFYLFTLSSVLATLSSPLVNALNATGKVKYSFYLMIMWTTLTWIFVPAFIKMYGFNGVAMAAVLISLTSFVPLYFVRKIVKLSFFVQIIKPILATVGMSLVLLTATSILPTALAKILIGAPLAIASYGLLIYFLMGKEVLSYLSLLKQPRTS
jgi:O-antigen/teichoic acid export membrane protein